MEVVLLKKALKDRDYWMQTGNNKIMKRITLLLKDIEQHPFTGLGKPEPLKGNLQGKWSRRITDESIVWFIPLVVDVYMSMSFR